jgi:hypothetical protein
VDAKVLKNADSNSCNGSGGKSKDKDAMAEEAKKQKAAKERESQTTRMVMLFSTVFFSMALPLLLSHTAMNIWDEYNPAGREKNLYNAIKMFSTLTSHLTETALFWVSLTYSRHFRRAVLRLPVARHVFRSCAGEARYASASGDGTSSSSSEANSATKRSVVHTQGP